MPQSIIAVNDLTKCFRTLVKPEGLSGSVRSLFRPKYRMVDAVNRIGFTVEKGEILAFIGPNGAGKSTTIKMLTGILYPTSGRMTVSGMNPVKRRRELAFKIGAVFGQKSQLWFHLPPGDSFRLLAGIYELPEREYRARLADLVELFELGDLMTVPVRKLSLGQRIRCEIAASLLHRPEIIFLDEPTIGLDVVAKQKIRDLIIRLNREEGATIFLTSHDTGDIEQLCRRAIIINHGRIVLDETMHGLRRLYLNHKIIRVVYRERVDIRLPGSETLQGNEGFQEENMVWNEGNAADTRGGYVVRVMVDTATQNLQQIIHHMTDSGEITDISISDRPLEEIIAAIYTAPRQFSGGETNG